jgi:hypothetical protein
MAALDEAHHCSDALQPCSYDEINQWIPETVPRRCDPLAAFITGAPQPSHTREAGLA